MARIELAPKGLDGFDRFIDQLAEPQVADTPQRVAEILQALRLLEHSPLIGRKLKADKRELVIGKDSRAMRYPHNEKDRQHES